MLHLIAPLLLSASLTSADLLPASVMSTENNPGYCEISDSTKAALKSTVDKLNDFDQPLTIDLDLFKKVAAKKLEQFFGPVERGRLVYQDMLGTGENAYFDFARLYYASPLPQDLPLGSDISLAYGASAAGELVMGFLKATPSGSGTGSHYDFTFPGLLTMFDSEKVSQADFIQKMRDYQQTIAPDLVWNDGEELDPDSILRFDHVNIPGADANKPVDPRLLQEFADLWRALARDPDALSVELDGEATIGTPTHGDAVAVQDSEASLDMNALRSVSLQKVKEGGIFATLPTLALPFGIGCVLDNPLLSAE